LVSLSASLHAEVEREVAAAVGIDTEIGNGVIIRPNGHLLSPGARRPAMATRLAALRSIAASFLVLLLLKLIDLLPLLVDLGLLSVDLRLGLRVLVLLILHLVANRVSGHAAEGAADCRAGAGRAHRRANYCARTRPDSGSSQGTFFTGAERRAGASAQRDSAGHHEQRPERYRHYQRADDRNT